MNTEIDRDQKDVKEIGRVFGRIWKIAFVGAILAAVPVTFTVEQYPWTIGLAITLAAGVGIIFLKPARNRSSVPVVHRFAVSTAYPAPGVNGWIVYVTEAHVQNQGRAIAYVRVAPAGRIAQQAAEQPRWHYPRAAIADPRLLPA
jgi:hypothetical protein